MRGIIGGKILVRHIATLFYLCVRCSTHVLHRIVNAANAIQPPILPNLPKGNPEGIKGKEYELSYDLSKAERILGIKYRSMEEMMRDVLEDFKKRGQA